MDDDELFKWLPGNLWNIILNKLHPKDRIIITLSLNKILRNFFINKVKWEKFIRAEFWQYTSFEDYCKKQNQTYNRNYPQFNPIIRKKTAFAKYYLLLKEEHIVEFIMPSYGTCDSPEQLARRFPKYCGKVYLSVVKRCHQPEDRGWRWHKWGEYYGEIRSKGPGGYGFKPEYLYDANGENGNPLIDETWVFERHNENRGGEYKFKAGLIVKRPSDK